jgi:iron complex transport system substrate-binding protein
LSLRGGATLLLLAGLAACGGPGRSRSSLHDDLGVPIELTGDARRVVSLSPSLTELLYAIGAGDRLVGRTRWADYPSEAEGVPSVGDGLDPNVELIVAHQPDLVVFYASSDNQSAIARLSALGIATASIRLDRLEDLPHAARLLGRLTTTSRRADSLAQRFQQQLDSARRMQPPAVRRAAVIVWDNPPIVIGAGSFLTQLLTFAGARNVFDDVAQPSVPTSVEAISARDPDVLVVLAEQVPAQLAQPQWRGVRAVRTDRIVTVAGSQFERPSLRAFAAVRELETTLARVRHVP